MFTTHWRRQQVQLTLMPQNELSLFGTGLLLLLRRRRRRDDGADIDFNLHNNSCRRMLRRSEREMRS